MLRANPFINQPIPDSQRQRLVTIKYGDGGAVFHERILKVLREGFFESFNIIFGIIEKED